MSSPLSYAYPKVDPILSRVAIVTRSTVCILWLHQEIQCFEILALKEVLHSSANTDNLLSSVGNPTDFSSFLAGSTVYKIELVLS